MIRHRLFPILLLELLAPLNAERIQAPDAPWRTLRTAHYRIHYPARGDFEPFALEVASKIEGIHAKVTEWVGYASPKPIEVVIRDPILEANGFAVPLLTHPFVVLWRTPPDPDSGIGHSTTWAELIVTHELTHIHHLLRPQNKPNLGDRLLDLPVGPIPRKAPRWVNEGYATVIEGKITGRGRPHSADRATAIRQWAAEGKLPDYGRISANEGFRGGSMAYLVGSAYLEWLEARTPDPDILKKFWKQLVSSKRRDFDSSFKATFGFAARDGYDRWRAEATRDALELERRAKAEGWLREGEVFTKVDGEVTDLAVSLDGTRLLARVLTKDFRGLRVWDLQEKDPHAGTEGKTKSDPEEVQDVKPKTPERKAKWELGRIRNAIPRRAEWKGEEVLLEIRQPNAEGVLELSLWSWKPGAARGPVRIGSRGLALRPGLVQERSGLWTILQDGKPVVRTLSAAWNPSETPDGRTIFYTQLSATGVEIRRLDLTRPLLDIPLPADNSALTARTVLPPADEPSTLPPPVPPAKPEAYDAMRSMWNGSRFGASLSPSGHAYQLGFGGADLLGQASWHVLAGAGNAAGPRGAAIGVAWRGWRWAPAVEVFSSLERPSRQEWVAPQGLDRERRGAEFSVCLENRGLWPFSIRPSLAQERVEWLGPEQPGGNRRVYGLEAGLRRQWRPSENWMFGGQFSTQVQAGQTLSQDWNLQRAGIKFQVGPSGELPLISFEAEAGRLGGGPSLDRFHLGGLGTSLVPSSLDATRIVQPALPDFLQRGDRFQRSRFQLGQGYRAYWEATVAWDHKAPRPNVQRVAGIELTIDDAVQKDLLAPLLGRTSFVAGLHRILQDGPATQKLKGRMVVTLSAIIRP